MGELGRRFDEVTMVTMKTLMDFCQYYNIRVIFEPGHFILEKDIRLDNDYRFRKPCGWRTYTKTYEYFNLNSVSTFEELADDFLADYACYKAEVTKYEGGYKEEDKCIEE